MAKQRDIKITKQEEQRVMQVIGGTAAGWYEHASAIMQVIEGLNKDAQVEAITFVIERFKQPSYRNDIEIDGAGISKKRLDELKQSLGGMVDGLLKYIVSSRLEPFDAAAELHKLIMTRGSDEEKTFCLYYVLLDRSIPYAPIPQSKTVISTERGDTLITELTTDVARVRAIIGFSNNVTVLADLLLSVIESQKDREKKVALMAYVVGDLISRYGKAK